MSLNIEQILEQYKQEMKQTELKPRQKQDEDICPECHQHGLFNDDGVLICRSCHTEFNEIIDDNAEWRNYSVDDNRSSDPTRCGSIVNPLLVESSYGTSIGYSNNGLYSRLRKLNNWQSMPHHERSLKMVFDRLTQSAFNSGLTLNIVEFSHKLFAEVSEKQNAEGETKLTRGDIRDGLISACLFYACKEYEVLRSPQEIGKICDVSPSDVTRGINLFYELMKDNQSLDLNKYITKYSDFIERYCNNLEICAKITSEIIAFGKKVDDLKILTKNTPQAVACGCIFFIVTMYKMNITKTQIAEKCGISVPTITKSYKRLLPYTQQLTA
jgi:transcription initiation factor TFIIIB Brf1 subunit/transcription initiation factor TFIIB